MKRLGELSPEMKARLARIGEAIARNQAEYPERFLYGCQSCRDTGYVVSLVYHNRTRQSYSVGKPCDDCEVGQSIQDRLTREKMDRDSAPKGAGELRRLAVVKRQQEVDGLAIDPSQDEDPPF